jgi:hypothetical protein
MGAQHPSRHQCGIFTNNAAPIIGFSPVVESLQALLLNTWPGRLRSTEHGLLYAGNRGHDAGGGSLSSFMVLIRGYG